MELLDTEKTTLNMNMMICRRCTMVYKVLHSHCLSILLHSILDIVIENPSLSALGTMKALKIAEDVISAHHQICWLYL